MFGMSQRVTSHPTRFPVCCCLPTPTALASGGIRCSRFWSTSQLIYPLAISSIIPAGSVHKSRGDSVVHMWVQLKRLCVGVAEGHSGAGCDLVSTLCKYDLRKGYLYVLIWGRVRRVRREVCVRV